MSSLQGKKLLVQGAIYLLREVVREAHKQGAHVTVIDYLENSPAKKQADENYLVSTTDVEAVTRLIRERHIDGILTGFIDSMLPYYQEICEKTGLPCYLTKRQIQDTTDKVRFKELCRQFDIPVVEEYQITPDATDEELGKLKYPVIVKPVDNSGARGISICRSPEELRRGIEYALTFSAQKKVIVERFMQCKEATLFYLFVDGEVYLTAMGNRHIQETREGSLKLPVAYTFPSRYLPRYLESIHPRVVKMFQSMGMKNGMAFIQSFVENGECIFYEIGLRLTGSLEYILLEAIGGYNPLEMMVRFALTGKMREEQTPFRPDPFFGGRYAGNLTFLIRPGTIGKVEGLEETAAIPGVVRMFQSYYPGDTIPEQAWGTLAQVVLRVLLVADTREELIEAMSQATRHVRVLSDRGEDLLLPPFRLEELRKCDV
ncbi:ATP-grasp domain-containing protein [uncultured Victivallis sp.]|uniref:ATP-grasp domain-containing protein n=1 Tax=uncultured Victivallis sp. TaxID=354118 RepID=UPI0025DEDAED|nr:ATP-grasp domain-containing protein [uncultured Victivallis sp.]